MLIKTRRSRDKVVFPYVEYGEPCAHCGYRTRFPRVYHTITDTPVDLDDATAQFALEQFPKRLEEIKDAPKTEAKSSPKTPEAVKSPEGLETPEVTEPLMDPEKPEDPETLEANRKESGEPAPETLEATIANQETSANSETVSPEGPSSSEGSNSLGI